MGEAWIDGERDEKRWWWWWMMDVITLLPFRFRPAKHQNGRSAIWWWMRSRWKWRRMVNVMTLLSFRFRPAYPQNGRSVIWWWKRWKRWWWWLWWMMDVITLLPLRFRPAKPQNGRSAIWWWMRWTWRWWMMAVITFIPFKWRSLCLWWKWRNWWVEVMESGRGMQMCYDLTLMVCNALVLVLIGVICLHSTLSQDIHFVQLQYPSSKVKLGWGWNGIFACFVSSSSSSSEHSNEFSRIL